MQFDETVGQCSVDHCIAVLVMIGVHLDLKGNQFILEKTKIRSQLNDRRARAEVRRTARVKPMP